MRPEHLGERLSAYVDGELGQAERAEVEDHLGSCRACRREHDRLVETRELLRGLPDVRPPFGFFRRLLPRRISWRQGLFTIALAAVAAAGFTIAMALTGGFESLRIRPDIEEHAARHATMVGSTAGAGSDLAGEADAYERMPAVERAPLVAEDGSLGPAYDAEASWWDEDNGIVHVMYRAGPEAIISVFAQEGRVAWSRLPRDGRQTRVGSVRAWRIEEEGSVIVVAEHANLVFTVVGSGSPADVAEVVAELPAARSLGVGERLRRATSDLVETFGLR